MSRNLPILILLVFLSGAALAQEASSKAAASAEWSVVGNVPLDSFVMQSHRGAGTLAPENTIEAFMLGWKLRTIPEADLRTTEDGVMVAFHDNNFARVVKDASAELKAKGVKDVTFQELSSLDVGGWFGEAFVGRRVSRMSEIYAVMAGNPERRLYLDIKDVDLRKLAEEVTRAAVRKQVILASPKPEQIREWKALVPESETLLWMGGTEDALRKRLADLRSTQFAGITQLQIHIHPNKDPANPNPFTLSNEFIVELGRELRSRGILFQALPYTSQPGVYTKLLDLGLAAFATDHPEAAWREIKAYYAR